MKIELARVLGAKQPPDSGIL